MSKLPPPLINRDPGDEQPEPLFNPDTTLGCTHPGCPNRPPLCKHELDIHHGDISPHARRPRTCLNAWNPATADIPF